VAGDQATIWVETTGPGTVEVTAGAAGGKARTFQAYGHHYAFVVVSGLPADSVTPYTVAIDGQTVWPTGDLPPSAIPTRSHTASELRLVFGSCREATAKTTAKRLPPDALDAYARRLAAALAREPGSAVPDVLVLLGDQVYADELSPEVRRWLAGRERPDGAPADQVVTFPEYARLYLESWSDPEIRWLLSTVPTVMIFDDHEIIDDWNSSLAWCREMQQHPWWEERIAAGLASYWVYQHLGNLDPRALAEDSVYRAVLRAGDATAVLRDFGAGAAGGSAYRWSYRLDLGATRLIVIDNRGARVLTPGERAMHDTEQWEWIVAQTRGEYEHLVLGCSLPWLLAPALHYVEAVMERLSDPRRGRVSVLVERVRRRFDMEHWPAVGRSFAALTALLTDLGTGDRAPATITVLGGDVHHSYVAPARLGRAVSSAVNQVVCSPMHNMVPPPIRLPLRAGWSRVLGAVARGVARLIGVRRPPVRWRSLARPYFGNAIGTLVYSGRSARVTLEGTDPSGNLHPFVATPLARSKARQEFADRA
jgi:hypothetical protein